MGLGQRVGGYGGMGWGEAEGVERRQKSWKNRRGENKRSIRTIRR